MTIQVRELEDCVAIIQNNEVEVFVMFEDLPKLIDQLKIISDDNSNDYMEYIQSIARGTC